MRSTCSRAMYLLGNLPRNLTDIVCASGKRGIETKIGNFVMFEVLGYGVEDSDPKNISYITYRM